MVRTSDDKKAFYLYNDYIDHVKLMSDEDAGKLFKAILEYENDLKVQELSGVAAMAFSFIKNQLDRDSSKYEEICKKNRANGMKGGRPRKNAEDVYKRQVVDIAADGKISADERDGLREVVQQLKNIQYAISEVVLLTEKELGGKV